jgi:tetratricopeptide (TPR) repeat protein
MHSLRTSQRMRAVSIEETGELQQDVEKLLATSTNRITLPKDFVKRTGEAELPQLKHRIDVEVRWWERPPVIAAVSVLAILGIGLAIASHQSSTAFEATLQDARRGIPQNPLGAVTVATKAIQNNGSSPRGYFYRGIAYGAAGQYDKSVADLDAAFMKGEDRKIVFLAKAAAAARAGMYDEAVAACEDVLRRDPKNMEAQSLKTLCEQLKKDQMPSLAEQPAQPAEPKRDDTKPVVKKPVGTSVIADALPSSDEPKLPSDPKKLVAMGYDYLRQGDKSSAATIFVEAIKRAPNNTDARRYLAHIMSEQGNAEGAVSQFNALVTLHALRSTDVVPYALALNDSGQTDHAREVLAHFIQQYPNDINLRSELVRMYQMANLGAQADALYRESLPLARTAEARQMLDDARGNSGDGETIHIRRR